MTRTVTASTELFLGYIAGLLTLISPCVLPVLPIVLASAMQAGRNGPIAVAAGMCLSFVTLGMLLSTFGYSIGLAEQLMSRIVAVMMMGFGLILLVTPNEYCIRHRDGLTKPE